MIEHTPVLITVTLVPLTVQTPVVVEAKLTVRPEPVVAVSVIGEMPKATSLTAPNVMVWGDWVTVKVRTTDVAAKKKELPD